MTNLLNLTVLNIFPTIRYVYLICLAIEKKVDQQHMRKKEKCVYMDSTAFKANRGGNSRDASGQKLLGNTSMFV